MRCEREEIESEKSALAMKSKNQATAVYSSVEGCIRHKQQLLAWNYAQRYTYVKNSLS